jgi:hypothetical protein
MNLQAVLDDDSALFSNGPNKILLNSPKALVAGFGLVAAVGSTGWGQGPQGLQGEV